MKKKISTQLNARESRLAEEAMGIKRDKNGKFATKAEYKQCTEELEECRSEKNVLYKCLEQVDQDRTRCTWAVWVLVITIIGYMTYTVILPVIDHMNDFIINSFTQI